VKEPKAFPKIKDYDIQRRIKECIEAGRWNIHPHAQERSEERRVSIKDIRDVLLNGTSGKSLWKPNAKPPKCYWYNKSKTVDDAVVKVVFYFLEIDNEPFMIVYTVCRN